MADKTVYKTTATTDQEWRERTTFGYEMLVEATNHDYDNISSFEYFATRTDGGKVFRAYAHKGTDMFVAEVIDRR